MNFSMPQFFGCPTWNAYGSISEYPKRKAVGADSNQQLWKSDLTHWGKIYTELSKRSVKVLRIGAGFSNELSSQCGTKTWDRYSNIPSTQLLPLVHLGPDFWHSPPPKAYPDLLQIRPLLGSYKRWTLLSNTDHFVWLFSSTYPSKWFVAFYYWSISSATAQIT